jgi:hypothetical protein
LKIKDSDINKKTEQAENIITEANNKNTSFLFDNMQI